MKLVQVFIFVVVLALATTVSAQSNADGEVTYKSLLKSEKETQKTNQTVGIAIDLLPPILSATTGNFGYSAQLWYGYNKLRVRGVVAGFQMPDKMMGNDDFKNKKTTATALILDCFRNSNFKGWWLGAGFEMWNNTITSKTDNKNYHFNDYVATAGTGYILMVYKNFYIEPWAAIHYVLNNEKVSAGIAEYHTKKFQGEVSLKVGWHF
jgi:hypothetical protein